MREHSIQSPVQPGKKSNAGRKPLDLDVDAMMRMRLAGKSDAEISRKFKCSAHTAASRLRDWKPPVVPPMPVQQAPAPPQTQPAPPTVVPKPPMVPVAVPQPQQAPVALPHVPEPPTDNAEALISRHPWLAGESAWKQCFFLVNAVNLSNLEFCTNNAQHGVAVERWHESYRGLEVFQNAARIWVVLDAAADNKEFLCSLVDDIWIREKCMITVGNILDAAKYKTDAKVGSKMSVESFEVAFGFKPMPQPNHVELVRQLLQKPTPAPESPQQSFDGFGASEPWGIGGTGYQAPSGWTPKLPSRSNPDGSNHGNDGSGFCF